jgi:hypothetical protein
MTIPIHAKTGTKAPNTFRVAGTVKGACELTILIDTGSSQSFIHPKIVERLSLPVKPCLYWKK